MHSPLPPTANLEAGLIDDPSPSRLSRVQENVRVLLRNSRFSLPPTSPSTTTPQDQNPTEDLESNVPGLNGNADPPDAPQSEQRTGPADEWAAATTQPSPSSLSSSPSPPNARYNANPNLTTANPPSSYRDTVQRMAHASALFNTRALAALNHPDLSDPSLGSLPTYVRYDEGAEKEGGERRRKNGGLYYVRRRGSGRDARFSEVLGCIFAGLMVAVVVGTYIVLATTSAEKPTPTFNVLFALGIILSAIVFAHALSRLLRRSKSPGWLVRRQHQHHHHHHQTQRVHFLPAPSPTSSMSSSTSRTRGKRHRHRRRPNPDNSAPFIPANSADTTAAEGSEVRPDSREAQPTPAVQLEQQTRNSGVRTGDQWDRGEWDRDADAGPRAPPPAYGKWRGSVRVDPESVGYVGSDGGRGGRRTRGPRRGADCSVIGSPREETGERPPSYLLSGLGHVLPERLGEGGDESGLQARVDEVEDEVQGEPEMVQVGGIGVAR